MVGASKTERALETVLHVSDQGRGLRSPLYLWMRQNHDRLRAEFQENGPRWIARTKAMGEAGLTDRDGKPPSVRTAQATWYQVVADLKRGTQEQPPEPKRPIPDMTPRQPDTAEPAEDDTKPKFTFAKPKS